jgi:hypothetical protein
MLIDLYSPTGYDFIYSFAFNENVDMHFHGWFAQTRVVVII